ncbi:MAG TPA: DUF4295 domain-containing protein [Candidatus Marinimicrobia bacterium]|jgi:hypothetical protein|nr:DUF4295 domain-containing protein [Candidatus Neomarinimicrobiota bacterium]
MAKQLSFAEKVAKKKKKNLSTYIKYIKSVQSEKTGYWRFNEQMIQVKEGENLDGALKRMEEEAQAIDMEMPVDESAANVETVEQDGADGPDDHEQAADDDVQGEMADVVAGESAAEVNELAGNAGDGTEAEKIEDVDAINEEQAENADGLGKVTSTKSDESA